MNLFKRKPVTVIFIFFGLMLTNLPYSRAQSLQLPLKIERYTAVMSEVNIRPYIKNLDDYMGLQLTAIQIEAGALVESATLDVFVNNSLQKKNLELGQNTSSFLILLDSDYFMGEGAEEIKFLISKPVYVKNVVLILTPKILYY